jgi:hypothetical protein
MAVSNREPKFNSMANKEEKEIEAKKGIANFFRTK